MTSQLPEEVNQLPVTLEDLDRAPDTVTPPSYPANSEDAEKVWKAFTEISREKFTLEAEISRLKRDAQTTKTLNDLAKPYAVNAFRFMCCYSGCVFVLLLLDGFSIVPFDLEQGLMQLLVGSTAATVIGLVATVLSGIFLARPK